MTKFGRTWWGRLWLNAFKGIDNSNRLPRGRAYVNDSHVENVSVRRNVVNAQVKGRKPSPYRVRVTLRPFSKSQRSRIRRAVTRNPVVLGQLFNGRLPVELYSMTIKHEIELLPKDWNSLRGRCSCPDRAAPCKHLAAVIYFLSLEIDKNPFMIFRLRGMDLAFEVKRHVNMLSQKREEDEPPETKTPEIVESPTKRERISPYELLEIDLSRVPNLGTQIFRLLQSEPLFYSGDFHTVLKEQYERVSDRINRLTSQEMGSVIRVRDYQGTTLQLDKHGDFEGLLDRNGKVLHPIAHTWIAELFQLRYLGWQSGDRQDTYGIYWYVLFRFALKILQQQALVPYLSIKPRSPAQIGWRPAELDQSVTAILEKLRAACPDQLIRVSPDTDNGASEEGTALSAEDQVSTALELIFAYFIELAFHFAPEAEHSDRVLNWFFTREGSRTKPFKNGADRHVVERWLNCLTLRDRKHTIFVEVAAIENGGATRLKHKKKHAMVEGVRTDTSLKMTVEVQQDSERWSLSEFHKQARSIEGSVLIWRDLTFIASYFPDLSRLLNDAITDTEESLEYSLYDFTPILLETLPVLRLLGVQLVLPPSIEMLVRPKVSVRVSSSSSALSSYMQLEDLVSFEWDVAVGETQLSREDFLKLAGKVTGLVQVNDEFVLIEEEQVDRVVEQLDELPDSMSSSEILKAGLTGAFNDAEVKLDQSFRELLSSIMGAESPPLPKGLNATLRDYQKVGYEWLVKNAKLGFGSLLADDMGLGKTLQVIALLLHQKASGAFEQSKALIVVPTSLITNWRKEIERFAPSLTVSTFHGSNRDYSTLKGDVVLTSYGVVRTDAEELEQKSINTVVIDEAQNIKNPTTQQTKSVKRIMAPIRVALTGTPVENRLLDYWSIFDFAMKDFLGSRKEFATEYAKPIELDRDQETLDKFRRITAPFILRRIKTDTSIISDLPEKIESDRYCSLTPEQVLLYKQMVDSAMSKLETTEDTRERRANVLTLIIKLKQICNSPSHFLKRDYSSVEESGKLMLFTEILKEALEVNEKVIVFTQFAEMGQQLVECVKQECDFEPNFLHGSVSRKGRDEMIESFQQDSKSRAMVLSLKAGGLGFNLTAASQVIHYDLWWNPAVEAQATDRAFRIGQTQNVLVHRLITENTFEERINDMIEGKKDLADRIVVGGNLSITDLSTEEIREIVSLRTQP